MPASILPSKPLCLIAGDEEFLVWDRAQAIYKAWCGEAGGMDHEIIPGAARNAAEALVIIARLNEALQTLPFFGGMKVVWLRTANFLGEDPAATSGKVTSALSLLSENLKSMTWDDVRLLISAGKADKRRTLYKTVQNLGEVLDISLKEKDKAGAAAHVIRGCLKDQGKTISADVLEEMVFLAGTGLMQLRAEAEKLVLYLESRQQATVEDVRAVVTRRKQARAFAVADALGERNLPRLLKTLDEELWEIRLDPKRSAIGMLTGIVTKVRTMILLKEMLRLGWIRGEGGYTRFKSQLEHIPGDGLPAERKFNPKSMHPYMLFNALPHARRYTQEELTLAMKTLLDCNRQMVTTSSDESRILQQALVRIVGPPEGREPLRVRS